MRLADFILAHLEPILADWEVFARGIWPDGAGATGQVALRDDAENMLRAAVTDMKSDQTSAEQSDKSKGKGDNSAHQSNVDRVSSMHGSARHDSGFDLPTVIAEYRALRGSVIRLWGESHPPPELSDLADLIRFNESIDQSLTQAVLAFSKLVERERQAALADQSRQAQRMREVNDALLVSSVRQHELAEQAQQAEASARASEERYRNLFESIDEGFCVIDMIYDEAGRPVDYRFVEVNPAFETQSGVADAVGKCVSEIVPDHEPHWYETYGEVARTGKPMRMVIEVKSVNRWFDVYACRIGGPGSTKVAVVFNDITERKRSEALLQQNHDTFYNLIESSPFGLYIVDAQLRMIKVSAASQNVFRNIRPLIGRDLKEIMTILWPEEFVRTVIGRFRHTLGTGEPYAMPNFSERRQDNSEIESYDWKIERITLPDGEYGVVCYFYDITERMLAEHKLQEKTDALAEADRRKNEFLAMLAHELRNPLAPIRNAALALQHSRDSGDAVRSAAAMIGRQVGQMVRLVDDLLDVSRVNRGKIALRRERVELASAVNHAVEAAVALYEGRNHDLTVTLPPQPVYLNADPTRIAQVVGNLLNNACKFTDDGGRIWLTVEREGEAAVIRVRDSGIGIAADELPRIFDLFTQIDTSLGRSVSGLGIGLTLVKNLVEMHDGTVEVYSAGVGHGSEFVVRLPVLAVTPEPPPAPAAAASATATTRRILVVDDNRDSAESLADLLELTGNVTRTAHDGVEAVEAAASFRPNLVLLDLGLPKMNGYEAARTIRNQSWGKAMVLVALTGWGQDEDRRKTKEGGFDAHLVKPVDFAVLAKLLTELLPTEDRPAGVARIANG